MIGCIVGKGSIGKRHGDILNKLGINVYFIRRNTKKKDEISGAAWDQSDIKDFKMQVFEKEEVEKLFLENDLFNTSTEVIWRDLARLTERGEVQRDDINRIIESAICMGGMIC